MLCQMFLMMLFPTVPMCPSNVILDFIPMIHFGQMFFMLFPWFSVSMNFIPFALPNVSCSTSAHMSSKHVRYLIQMFCHMFPCSIVSPMLFPQSFIIEHRIREKQRGSKSSRSFTKSKHVQDSNHRLMFNEMEHFTKSS